MKDHKDLKAAIKGKKILLFGPPGSGKGNRSRDLEALGLVHVSSGIALRTTINDNLETMQAKRASDFMKRGELVPDDIVVPVVLDYLDREECWKKGFVLDGFPRTKIQSDILDAHIDLDLVLYLDVPGNFLITGIIEGNRRGCSECGAGYSDFDPPKVEGICDKCAGKITRRADDKTTTIKNRLKLYKKQTRSFLPDLEVKGIVRVLPIIVNTDEEIENKYLKKLKDKIYWVETDLGKKVRMLNLAGMKERLYRLLAEYFL